MNTKKTDARAFAHTKGEEYARASRTLALLLAMMLCSGFHFAHAQSAILGLLVPINFGETAKGSIDAAAEVDVFTFTANAEDTILVRASRASESVWPGIRVFDPNGNLLREVSSSVTAEIGSLRLPIGGTYSIHIFDSFNGTLTGQYCAYLQRLDGPGNALNISFSETQYNTIDNPAEMEAYTFEAEAGDKVLVSSSRGNTGSIWPGVRVYSPSGVLLREATDSRTAEIDGLTLPATGLYTILVFDSFNGTQIGEFGLHLQRFNNPVNAFMIDFGETRSGAIDRPGKLEAYTFVANAADRISVRMSRGSGSVWPGVRVYSASGVKLGQAESSTTSEIASLTLAEPGVYTILCYDSFGGLTGNYNLFLGCLAPPLKCGAPRVFFSRLEGKQEVPGVETNAIGGGMAILQAGQAQFDFRFSFGNLSGPITSAHFHNGAPGTLGGIVKALNVTSDTMLVSSWKSTDVEPLTPQLVTELLAGRIYVNLYTGAHPQGEIRGQLVLETPIALAARIEGEQEVPPLRNSGAGFGAFMLNAEGTELTFNVAATGLSGTIIAAHFHRGTKGRNGNVVKPITNSFTGNLANGVWKNTDTDSLTPALIADLLAEKIYVNLQTVANPNGEIRGQIVPAAEAVAPIGAARLLSDNTANISIEGTVTTIDFELSRTGSSEYYLQDATGGIRLAATSGKAVLQRGQRVRVKSGAIISNAGRKTISAHKDSILVLDAPGLPEAQYVTINTYRQNRAAFEGELVFINDANITGNFPAAGSDGVVTLNDGTGNLDMFIDLDTDIDGASPSRIKMDITGVATSFNNTLRIQPSSIDNISLVAERAGGLPSEFALAQNYPNPLNPSTTIRYALPRPGHVKLVIYDLLGAKIRTLVDGRESAGFKHITWDGMNEKGDRVPSGVYVYRMEAGEFTMTKKLTVMK